MKSIRRVIISVLSVITAILLAAVPAWAYVYYASYTITETSGNSYTMLPTSVSSPNTWMADNGFMLSTALDTRVETLAGAVKPHMVADDRTNTAIAVGANSQTNLYFTTGSTALTSMDIIPGYGGYITAKGAAALDLGSNFSIQTGAYLLPLTVGNIVNQASGFNLGTPTIGSVVASELNAGTNSSVYYPVGASKDSISGAYSTVSILITATDWVAQTFTTTSAYTVQGVALKLHGAATYTVSIRAVDGAHKPTGADLASGTFVSTYLGVGISDKSLVEVVFNTPVALADATEYAVVVRNSVGNGRLSATNVAYAGGQPWDSADSGATWASSGAIDFNLIAYGVDATAPLLSGLKVIRAYADGANFKLDIDGTNVGSVAVGAGCAAAGTDFVIMSALTPYITYYTHTVGGTLIINYDPVDRIHGQTYSTGTVTVTTGDATVTGAGGATWTSAMEGSIFVSADGVWYVVSSVTGATTLELTTTYGGGSLGGQAYNMYPLLPDREGAAQNAEIFWGSNPAGVAVALGGLLSAAQPVVGSDTTDTVVDVLPTVPVNNWFQAPAVGTTLLTNPMRPFVLMLSDNSSLTEIQAWRFLGLVFVIGTAVAAAKAIRGHLVLVGIAAGAAVGVLVALTVWPFWTLVFAIGAVIGGAVAERSPYI